MAVLDDLSTGVPVSGPAHRVVSLVPSLTESVAMTRPEVLVGATDWCTHPTGLTAARVRGTKNPDIAAILALAPDLVIANKEAKEYEKLDPLAVLPILSRLVDHDLANTGAAYYLAAARRLARMRRIAAGTDQAAGVDALIVPQHPDQAVQWEVRPNWSAMATTSGCPRSIGFVVAAVSGEPSEIAQHSHCRPRRDS